MNGIWVKFHIESNRGTNQTDYKWFDFNDWGTDIKSDKDTLQSELERWCSQFYAWTASCCNYDFKIVKKPPKEWLENKLQEIKAILVSKKNFADMIENLLEKK